MCVIEDWQLMVCTIIKCVYSKAGAHFGCQHDTLLDAAARGREKALCHHLSLKEKERGMRCWENIQNRCTMLAEREREIARDTERETKRQINMKEIIKILIEDLV